MRKELIFVDILKANEEKSRISIRIKIRLCNPAYRPEDFFPDPHQNITDPDLSPDSRRSALTYLLKNNQNSRVKWKKYETKDSRINVFSKKGELR
jgi:hypothetical protein